MAAGSSRMFSTTEVHVLQLLEQQEEYEENMNQIDWDAESDDSELAEGDFVVNRVNCLAEQELLSRDSTLFLVNSNQDLCDRDSVLLYDEK